MHAEEESTADPDNVPARSRLFLVVPKAADGAAIEVSQHCILSMRVLHALHDAAIHVDDTY